MSRPPVKAVKQIRDYCEKTQCRRCVYGDCHSPIHDDIDYVGCKLQMHNPCDWEMPKEEQDNASN